MITADNRTKKMSAPISPVAQGFWSYLYNRRLCLNVYRNIVFLRVVYCCLRFFRCVFCKNGSNPHGCLVITVKALPAVLIRFSTLTARCLQAYDSHIAETTAARIGVLNERGESHSESSGYFYVSRTLNGRRWTGGRKAAGAPRSRYANPVQLPPTPIGVGGRFYQTNRSLTMSHNISSFDNAMLRIECANSLSCVLSIITSPDGGKPSAELLSLVAYSASILLEDAIGSLNGGEKVAK